MDDKLKILHIAPQNFAGMPMNFVKMHKRNGCESRLVTLYKNTLDFEEDISLNFELPTGKFSKRWRDKKIISRERPESLSLKYYNTSNTFENLFFKMRDFIHSGKITKFIDKYKLFDYDIYHFDGGMDLFRDLRFAKSLKSKGKKIVCCYFGSDLRSRGVFRELDEISDLNLTVEYDHINLHHSINYLYFPFDVNAFSLINPHNEIIKIVHSPTNRLFKGTDKILNVIDEVKKVRKLDFVLVENLSRGELLEIKSKCDLAIDQVGGELGGTGYGNNSIENLSMGLPTITEFSNDYLDLIPDNPFIHTKIGGLKDTIINLIDDRKQLSEFAIKGRKWVEKYHSLESVNARMLELYRQNGIIN